MASVYCCFQKYFFPTILPPWKDFLLKHLEYIYFWPKVRWLTVSTARRILSQHGNPAFWGADTHTPPGVAGGDSSGGGAALCSGASGSPWARRCRAPGWC